MQYRMQDLIDMELFQDFQDRLNEIYSFSSAIVDNDGNILTATAWQDICINFHRKHPECEKECIKSDQYILSHLHEANPAVSYRCPHGLVDNATPIIIDGIHYGNFFTGQFFLEQPDMEFFRAQAEKYGFDEKAYLEAVSKVPVWTQEQLDSYLFFIKGLIAIISESGLKHLKDIESRQQIEESNERAETILNQMQDGFWIVNIDDVQVIEVNDAMCRLLGYSRDELLTMTLADVEVNHSPEEIAQKIQLIKKNGSSNFESRFRRKDGSVFHVDVSITYLEKRNLFFGFHRDITSRKQGEEALQTSESKYRELADLLPQIVFEIDLQGNLTFLNKKAYEIFGYTEQDLPELLNAFDLIATEDRQRAKDNAARLLNGLPPINSEYRALRKDGSTTPINIYSSTIFRNGDPVGIRGLIVDITEQKQTEEALRESEERFEGVLFSIADWVWEVNKDGVYTYSSQKGSDILGRNCDEIIGETPFDFMPPDEAKRIAAIFSDIAAQKAPIINLENINIGKNGEEIWLLTNGVPVLDENGNLTAYRGADQDITERKLMASALQESEKRYRVFLDSTDDMAFLKDDQFRYLMVNRANAEFFGKDETEIRGKTDFDLMPEKKRSEMPCIRPKGVRLGRCNYRRRAGGRKNLRNP